MRLIKTLLFLFFEAPHIETKYTTYYLQLGTKKLLTKFTPFERRDLSLNRIESISSEAFSDQMSNLNSLNLNGNPLTQIDPNAFVHLSRLRKL